LDSAISRVSSLADDSGSGKGDIHLFLNTAKNLEGTRTFI